MHTNGYSIVDYIERIFFFFSKYLLLSHFLRKYFHVKNRAFSDRMHYFGRVKKIVSCEPSGGKKSASREVGNLFFPPNFIFL